MGKTYIIIPARMNSKRLPNKPLLDKTGKYLVQHTWEQCIQVPEADGVFIATDSTDVLEAAESFKARAIVTGNAARCGTERCCHAAEYLPDPEFIINVQCEYPMIDPRIISAVITLLKNFPKRVITAIYKSTDEKKYKSKNYVKAITSGQISHYFSRRPIPYQEVFKYCILHIGIYGFKFEPMRDFYIDTIEPSTIVKWEGLEQLEWLGENITVTAAFLDDSFKYLDMAVDTKAQYAKFVREYAALSQSG